MKANASVGAKAIEPGKYTVILEPVAATYMLENMFRFDARSAEEGRSFLSKKGGGTRLGEQLMDPKVTIYSDPFNPDLPGSTWGGDGLPREKTVWIDKGCGEKPFLLALLGSKERRSACTRPKQYYYGRRRRYLRRTDKKHRERGILVSRLWYIRMVDPQSLLLTGLTRDGTFYIENGKIMFPVSKTSGLTRAR
jgi:predicted Zn-dependent protease